MDWATKGLLRGAENNHEDLKSTLVPPPFYNHQYLIKPRCSWELHHVRACHSPIADINQIYYILNLTCFTCKMYRKCQSKWGNKMTYSLLRMWNMDGSEIISRETQEWFDCSHTSPSREYSVAVQLDRITFPQPYMSGSAPRSGPVFLPFVQIFFYPGAFKSFRGVREGEQSSGGSCSCRSLLNVKPEGVLSHPLLLPSNAIWGVNLGDCWASMASLFWYIFGTWGRVFHLSQLVSGSGHHFYQVG